jgi:hypothetical protein
MNPQPPRPRQTLHDALPAGVTPRILNCRQFVNDLRVAPASDAQTFAHIPRCKDDERTLPGLPPFVFLLR